MALCFSPLHDDGKDIVNSAVADTRWSKSHLLTPPDTSHSAVADSGGSSGRSDSDDDESEEYKLKVHAVTQSYTFPNIMVLVAGCVLACCAGIVDVVSFLALGRYLTHVTGSVATFGFRTHQFFSSSHEDVMGPGYNYTSIQVEEVAFCVFFFCCGACLSGLLVAKNEVRFGESLYGCALLGVSAFLVTGTYLAHLQATSASMYTVATAMGMQNGMCTMHFGAQVRTTHVTGLVTDVGTSIGRILAVFIRRQHKFTGILTPLEHAEMGIECKRLVVFVVIFFGFYSGAIIGTRLYIYYEELSYLVPAFVTGTGGLVYCVIKTVSFNRLQKVDDENDEAKLQQRVAEMISSHTTSRYFDKMINEARYDRLSEVLLQELASLEKGKE